MTRSGWTRRIVSRTSSADSFEMCAVPTMYTSCRVSAFTSRDTAWSQKTACAGMTAAPPIFVGELLRGAASSGSACDAGGADRTAGAAIRYAAARRRLCLRVKAPSRHISSAGTARFRRRRKHGSESAGRSKVAGRGATKAVTGAYDTAQIKAAAHRAVGECRRQVAIGFESLRLRKDWWNFKLGEADRTRTSTFPSCRMARKST